MNVPADDPRLTFGRFLTDVSARYADREALRFGDLGEWRCSYAQLEQASRALAKGLIAAGAVKGARVAILMGNRPDWIECAFAVGMIGGVAVPVNTFASRSELDFILRHSDASLLVAQPSLLEHRFLDDLIAAHPALAEGEPGALRCVALPQLRRVACLGDGARGGVESLSSWIAAGREVSDDLLDALVDEVEPSDDGLIIYTSGTTSQPKGVVHLQRAAILQGRRFADLMRLSADDRIYTTYPFFWSAGIAMSLIPSLASGACLLLQETFEAGAALDLIEAERATAVHAWPHQHKALGEHPSAAERDLASVRKVDFSMPIAKLAGIDRDEYGTGASYGMSETFTIASMIPADSPLELRSSTSGRALPGTTLRIVDPETGERLPAGTEGEIAVKGVTFMRGYQKVLPELSVDADGYFRTQDGGLLDGDGYLHWTGRLSNLIKTGGANVSPVEIQEVLEAHPDLRLAVAVGIGHPTLGEVVVLCAVLLEGAVCDEQTIRAWLRKRLAAYKVPKRVLFFRNDELSFTANQKVQVEPLKDLALAKLEAEGAEIDGYTYTADYIDT